MATESCGSVIFLFWRVHSYIILYTTLTRHTVMTSFTRGAATTSFKELAATPTLRLCPEAVARHGRQPGYATGSHRLARQHLPAGILKRFPAPLRLDHPEARSVYFGTSFIRFSPSSRQHAIRHTIGGLSARRMATSCGSQRSPAQRERTREMRVVFHSAFESYAMAVPGPTIDSFRWTQECCRSTRTGDAVGAPSLFS